MAPEWCAKYVGTLFREKGRGPYFDCWGLARVVLQHEFGLDDLPDYAEAYLSSRDKGSVAAAIGAGLAEGWRKVAQPAAGCIVILRLAGRPWHCGVMADGVWMLHTTEGTNAVMERVDSLQWRGRVEGFYCRC